MSTESPKNASSRLLVTLIIILSASIAGNLWLVAKHKPDAAQSSAAESYICPMHPQVVSDHAIDCPICGMKLVKKSQSASNVEADSVAGLVHLSPSQELLANIRVETPQYSEMGNTYSAPAKIVAKNDSKWKWSLRVMARIDSLFITEPGTIVHAGDRLGVVSSPDYKAAWQEYLAVADGAPEAVRTATDKLKSLGLTSTMIVLLSSGDMDIDHLPFTAPRTGVLMEKMATRGEWVMPGMTLLDFIDLSDLWVEASIFATDASSIHIGTPVSVIIDQQRVSGVVKVIGVELDMMNRTLPVSISISNASLNLRPGMLARVEWNSTKPMKVLTLPTEAVLQTGQDAHIWVKQGDGRYKPVTVRTGAVQHGRIAIIEGINENDVVAVNGAYLIDSESQLKGFTSAQPEQSSHAEHSAASPQMNSSAHDHEAHTGAKSQKTHLAKYICPMHCPGSDSEQPGKCKVCGMFLEPNPQVK